MTMQKPKLIANVHVFGCHTELYEIKFVSNLPNDLYIDCNYVLNFYKIKQIFLLYLQI